MPRRARSIQGGLVYHILNRANARMTIFEKDDDYAAFERVLEESHARDALRILAYCVMPNHWHMVVWPKRGADEQVSEFFRWLTVTHTQRWHAHHHTAGSGHLYQGRFHSVRANLVEQAEAWRWSSAWRYCHGDDTQQSLLADWPIPRPRNWRSRVNQALNPVELDALHRSVQRGRPYGSDAWCRRTIARLGLEWTVRSRGRPRKAAAKPA